MAEVRQFDIAIVGAGIAGAALAVALSGKGLSIALIESQPLNTAALPTGCSLQDFDPRVSALTPRSRAFLQQLGAWQSIVDYRHCAYHHMTVWDAEGTGDIEFDCAEVKLPELGHIVENRVIIRALLAKVEAASDISLLQPVALRTCARLNASRMRLELEDGGALEVDLLVAADGALSRVRTMMAFESREWNYGHHAIVATVEVARSHENTAWQRFLPTGPLALLPLPSEDGRHYCSIVWSVQEHLIDDLLALEEQPFRAALESAIEGRIGTVIDITDRFAFPLRQRHAVDYVQSGVALVADAAHTIHPLAGQGINLGLQDIAVLAEEILAGHARGVSPGQLQLLRRYQRRRKGDNLLMMTAMDSFKRLFEQQSLPVRWLRNAGMRIVGQIPPLKQQLLRHAMGLE